jgi:hypothetical protein
VHPKRGLYSVSGHPKTDFERSDLASPTIAKIHRPRKKPCRPFGRQGFSQVRGVALLLLAESIERLGQTIGRNPIAELRPAASFHVRRPFPDCAFQRCSTSSFNTTSAKQPPGRHLRQPSSRGSASLASGEKLGEFRKATLTGRTTVNSSGSDFFKRPIARTSDLVHCSEIPVLVQTALLSDHSEFPADAQINAAASSRVSW